MCQEACEIKIASFYKATIWELMMGTSVRSIKNVLKDFEEEELYEECEGINRAIQFYGDGKSFQELEEEYYI